MLTNPHITFTFSDGTTQDTYNLIKDSIVVDLQRMKDLKASSNRALFTLKREPVYRNDTMTLTGKILTDVNDIKAQLKDGNKVIFTGYVSNNKKWSVKHAGLEDISLSIEDIGIRKLKVPSCDSELIYHDTVSNIVKFICDKAGVDIASNHPNISTLTYATVSPNISCNDILNDLLMEYGYVFYFNNEGKFCYELLHLNAETYPTHKLWANSKDTRFSSGDGKLSIRGKSAIDLSRNISTYSKAGVCYSTLKERSNQKIFDACPNGSTLNVNGRYWWDGVFHESDPNVFTPSVNFSQNYISGVIRTRAYQITSWQSGISSIKVVWDDTFKKSDLIGHAEYSVFLAKKTYETYWDGTGYRRSSNWYYEPVSEEKYFTHQFGFFEGVSSHHRNFFLNCYGMPEYLVFKYHSIFGDVTIKNFSFGPVSVADTQQGGEVEALDIKQGKKLWEIKNVVPSYTKTSTASPQEQYIEAVPNRVALNVMVNNTAEVDEVTYSKFEASADIVATDVDQNWVYSNSDTPDNKMYKYEAKYIHDADTAKALVANLAKYYTYCQNTYTFYSQDDLELNSIVNIIDNMFSNLNINVCITSKKYVMGIDDKTTYTYSGYAISDIGYVYTRGEGYMKQSTEPAETFRFNFRGDWQANADYVNTATIVDVVFYDGSSWMCKQSNKGNAPAENSLYWTLMAKRGDTEEDIYDFRLSANSSTYIRNKRVPRQNNYITISTHIVGYTGLPVLSANWGLTIDEDGLLVVPYDFAYDTITILAVLDGAPSQTLILSVVDNTEYDAYLGVASSAPTASVIAGDSYFDSETSTFCVYDGVSWGPMSTSYLSDEKKSAILAKAQSDVLSRVAKGTVSSSDYGYFNSIITSLLTASQITMTNQGIIQSEGVSNSSVGSDGFLTTEGYRLEGSSDVGKGIMRANNAYIENFHCKDAHLVNANISGELIGKYINTVAPSNTTFSISVARPTTTYYNGKVVRYDIVDAICNDPKYRTVGKNNSESPLTGYFGTKYFNRATAYSEGTTEDSVYRSSPSVIDGADGYSRFYVFKGINTNYVGLLDNRYTAQTDSNRVRLYSSSGALLVDSNSSKYRLYKFTTAMFDGMNKLPVGSAYYATGTVSAGGVSLSGNGIYCSRTSSSVTFSQDGKSVTLTKENYIQSDLYVSLTVYEPVAGIQTSSIYPQGTANIGSSTSYFSKGYISELNAGTVNATYVYGAVFN